MSLMSPNTADISGERRQVTVSEQAAVLGVGACLPRASSAESAVAAAPRGQTGGVWCNSRAFNQYKIRLGLVCPPTRPDEQTGSGYRDYVSAKGCAPRV